MSEPATQIVPFGATMPLGARLVDMKLLPETYAWPRRGWAWFWWKLPPFRWLTRLLLPRRRNPYRKVVAIVRLDPVQVPQTTERKLDMLVRGGDHDLPVTDDQIAASPLFRRPSPDTVSTPDPEA